MIAFSDRFDAASSFLHELRKLHPGLKSCVQLVTDSKTLFDRVLKKTRTSNKRFKLGVACAGENFLKMEITDIGFIRLNNNSADGLTKSMR